jgi:hypothetical protein
MSSSRARISFARPRQRVRFLLGGTLVISSLLGSLVTANSAGAEGSSTVNITLSPQGCQPKPAKVSMGEINFNVVNKNAGSVSEAELPNLGPVPHPGRTGESDPESLWWLLGQPLSGQVRDQLPRRLPAALDSGGNRETEGRELAVHTRTKRGGIELCLLCRRQRQRARGLFEDLLFSDQLRKAVGG